MKIFTIVFAATLLAQTAPAALAQMSHGSGHGMSDKGDKTAGIKVSQAWARATARTAKTGAAYVTLENTGDAPDRLVSASAPVTAKAELHTHIKDGDVMKMREAESIEVGPHAKVMLRPGGLHIMMMGLKEQLVKGGRFPLTLTFEKAGKMTVDVAVEAAGAMGPDGGKMDGQSHGGMKH